MTVAALVANPHAFGHIIDGDPVRGPHDDGGAVGDFSRCEKRLHEGDDALPVAGGPHHIEGRVDEDRVERPFACYVLFGVESACLHDAAPFGYTDLLQVAGYRRRGRAMFFDENDPRGIMRVVDGYQYWGMCMHPYKLEDGTYVKRVKARELWNSIVTQAHKNAEPGVLFWDNILKESPADCYADDGFVTKGTNPCITGDALIKTDKGNLTIPEIMEKYKIEPIKVLTLNEKTKELEYQEVEVAQKTKDNANIIEIETDDGDILHLTPDHLVYTENRGWIEAAHLTENDVIVTLG